MNTLPAIDHEYVRDQVAGRMKDQNISQHELERRTGGAVAQTTISAFLSRTRETLGLEYIEAIAAALGCQRHELTGEQPVTIVRMIEARHLRASPQNPRHQMDAEALKELMDSILDLGVLQNLTVRPDPADGEAYFVVSGHRRLAAVMLAVEAGSFDAGYAVPCRIIQGDDTEALTEALVENLHREDMHPLDEADAYEKIQEWAQCSAAEVARRVGKEPRYVQQRLALHDKLSVKVKGAFRQGQINFTQARILSTVDEDIQETLLTRAIQGGYYAQAEQLESTAKWEQAQKEKRANAPPPPPAPTEEEKAEEEREYEEKEAAYKERLEARRAEMDAEQDAAVARAAQFNTIFRAGFKGDLDLVARQALRDLISKPGNRSLSSMVVGSCPDSGVVTLRALLGVESQTDDESAAKSMAWFERIWTAIDALEQGKAAEILLRFILATSGPAIVDVNWTDWFEGRYDLSQLSYRATLRSARAMALAERLGVTVPADMLPEAETADTDDDDGITDGEGDDTDAGDIEGEDGEEEAA